MYILSKTLSKNTFFNIQLKSMSTLSYTDFSKANGCLKLHNINTKLTILEGLLKFQRLRTNVSQQEIFWDCYWSPAWEGKTSTDIYIRASLRCDHCKGKALEPHTLAPKETTYGVIHAWLTLAVPLWSNRVVALNCAWKSLYLPPTQQSHLVSAFPYHTACCYTARCITRLNS